MELYSYEEELVRAAEQCHVREYTPPSDAYLLPPFQATLDAFLTRSSLLSPPPMQMRGYGQPEYLWQRFDDWYKAPAIVRPLIANHAAVGFRLRWPRAPVVVKTREQEAWVKHHVSARPFTMLERIEQLFNRWGAELRAHNEALQAPTPSTDLIFYRIKPEYPDSPEQAHSSPDASSTSSGAWAQLSPDGDPTWVHCPPSSPDGQPLWTHWSPADTHEPRLFALDEWVVSRDS